VKLQNEMELLTGSSKVMQSVGSFGGVPYTWWSRLTMRAGGLLQSGLVSHNRASGSPCQKRDTKSATCLVARAWDTKQVLPCDAVNLIVKNVKWKPRGKQLGAYWTTRKQVFKLAGMEWSLTLLKSERTTECGDRQRCRMSKLLACSHRGISGAEACCTQKSVKMVGPEKSTQDQRLPKEKVEKVDSWTWPATGNLSILMPKVAGAKTLVAGQVAHEPNVEKNLATLKKKFGGCVSDGFSALLGTAYPLAETPGILYNFQSHGVSTSLSWSGMVDVWVADLPLCIFKRRGHFGTPSQCHVCGESGKISRILHVNGFTGKAQVMLSSTKEIFLDVAANGFLHKKCYWPHCS